MADYGIQNATHSFNLPSPYQADLNKLAQQQKMAELLQAQSLQPSERYSYKGIEAQTPVTAGLAKMLQGFTAMQMQEKGLEEQKALGERYQSEGQDAIRRSLEAMQDTPARAAVLDPQEREQMADQGTQAPAQIPAQKADPYRALALSMKNPLAQQIVGPMATQRIGSQFDMDALTRALGDYGKPQGTAPSTPDAAPGAAVGSGTVLAPGQPQAASQSPIPSWMPPTSLLGAGKFGPKLFEALSAANKPSDLQQQLTAAGIPINSPEGVRRVLDPSGRLAAQEATLVDFTIPGTDQKVRLPNNIASALATQTAPDVKTAELATNVAQRYGMKVNIGVGTPGGINMESPKPLGAAELKGMEKGAESTMAMIPKELSESLEIAKNAEKRHETIQQIHGAIQSNKAILGPGATAATWLQRVGESAFGPGNKKNMVETQQVIQGLSDLALSGASTMRGQGAITEGERELLMKAKSGVQNLLPSELNALLTIFDKQARNDVSQHNEKMKRAEKAKFQNLEYWGNVPDLPPLGQAKVGTNLSPAAIEFMQKNNIPIPGAK